MLLACFLQALDEVARSLVGDSVFVSWPHLTEAYVVAVSDGQTKVGMPDFVEDQHRPSKGKKKDKFARMELGHNDQVRWNKEVSSIGAK